MKSLCITVTWVLVSGAALMAQTPRVRPLDSAASAAYQNGRLHSETFRGLDAKLQASDLIVHVVTTAGLPDGMVGMTRFAGSRGGARYVRIDLAACLSAKSRVATFAHELQHAFEIARSGADSSAAVGALYRAIGRPSTLLLPSAFETNEAEAAGRVVWIELSASGRIAGGR